MSGKIKQLAFGYRTHGGFRPRAGRKPVGRRAGEPHAARSAVVGRLPLHVTMRVVRLLPSLRSERVMTVLRAAFARGRERFGFRLVQYAVQPDHLHLIVEASQKKALSEGARGLCVRIARHLNAELGRAGKVFAERYHARALATPREVRRALAYVLLQERRHAVKRRVGMTTSLDACSSAPCFDGFSRSSPRWGPEGTDEAAKAARATVVPAKTWLLTVGWRRHGLVDPAEVPGAPAR
jgi:REP-associated tyrosine transposase